MRTELRVGSIDQCPGDDLGGDILPREILWDHFLDFLFTYKHFLFIKIISIKECLSRNTYFCYSDVMKN